ncbi:hypothetical protein GPJ56_007203 [Histomonas meleagridis]|uniref:uncharacterized protein n=1 Tax=Histomonas meleagridis TaxID=135588 RepID=UPI0035599DA2|nr:hypothetical protein GPJ56_007203 [Histomonas meleagridis]KAH0800126.1 hypothetical protein GO595_007238 [Histomonas meleagridis]
MSFGGTTAWGQKTTNQWANATNSSWNSNAKDNKEGSRTSTSKWGQNTTWTYGQSGFGTSTQGGQKKQSFATQKTFTKSKLGGWGVKVEQQTTGYGTTGFGFTSFGTNGFGKSNFGTTSFGTNGWKAGSTFGTQQDFQVPITTKGFPFKESEQEDGQERNRVVYHSKHISVLELFACYTVEELRFYDYVKTGKLSAPWQATTISTGLGTQFSFGKTSTETGGLGFAQQAPAETVSKFWYNVPIEQWKQIPDFSKKEEKKEETSTNYSQTYGDLPQNQYTTLSHRSEIEIPKPLEEYTLKGFNKFGTIGYQLSQRAPPKSKTIGADKLDTSSSGNAQATTTLGTITRTTTQTTSARTNQTPLDTISYYPQGALQFSQNQPFIVSLQKNLKDSDFSVSLLTTMTFLSDFSLQSEDDKKTFKITAKQPTKQEITVDFSIEKVELVPKNSIVFVDTRITQQNQEEEKEANIAFELISKSEALKPQILKQQNGSVVIMTYTSCLPISIIFTIK